MQTGEFTRVTKFCWFSLVTMLTGWLPDFIPFMRFRGLLLRPAFKSCGSNFQIARRVTINYPNKMEIGRDVYIATGCWILAVAGVVMEDEVQLAPFVVLATGNHALRDGSYRYGSGRRAPIRLCKGAWVGAHGTLTAGVTLGQGSALGANGVATRSIPDFSIAVGVPARVLHHEVPQSVA